MKSTFIIAALAATATVHAYQCPSSSAVSEACKNISVRPLLCNNPNVNVQQCNAKQCIQSYIDNYAACQCRRSATDFYDNSVNVEGLVRRCGMAALKNPYGDPYQYRPNQGTRIFSPSSPAGGATATRIFNGTTYFGGQTGVVSGTTRIVSATAVVNGTMIMPGTTTWVSNTPGIIGGTSTLRVATTAAPIVGPSEVPVSAENTKISGGAIAGIVLGTLAAAALAGLLGWCWRKKRSEHTAVYSHSAYDNRAPTRTVVTEKIEPVVVKANSGNVPANATTTYTAPAVSTTGTNTNTSYTTSTQAAPVAHSTTTYNTTTPASTTYQTNTSGYNTQPRTGGVVSNAAHGVVNAVETGANTVATGASNMAHSATNATSNFVHGTANAPSNAAHGTH